MKALLLLVTLGACATDGAEPTAPFYTSFDCAIADRFLTCDLGFTDPDGDFERITIDVSEAAGTRFAVPPQSFPDLAGKTEGFAHFEVTLPQTPMGLLYVSVRMFDRTGESTYVPHPVIDLP